MGFLGSVQVGVHSPSGNEGPWPLLSSGGQPVAGSSRVSMGTWKPSACRPAQASPKAGLEVARVPSPTSLTSTQGQGLQGGRELEGALGVTGHPAGHECPVLLF